MSRLFEYLRALDGDIEHLVAAKVSPSNGAHHDDDASRILSVLHLPHAATPALPMITPFRVAAVDLQPQDRVVCLTDPGSPAAHRFRLLRVRLRELQKARSLKTLLITSALPQDGKSTVVMNLATALSQQGKHSILVVDGDLHRCSLTQRLSPRSAGLAECIARGLDPSAAIHQLQPLGWHFLPAGTPPENASELLHNDVVSGILQKLGPSFDWILLDSPPVAPLADSVSFARSVDGVLFVMKADSTPKEAVEDAISLVGKKRVVGVVLNGIQESDHLYHRYSEYYGRGGTKKDPQERPTGTPTPLST